MVVDSLPVWVWFEKLETLKDQQSVSEYRPEVFPCLIIA